MRCSNVKNRIDDHADGVLPAREAEAVRDHLEACAECRDLAFAAKAASASLAQWGDLDPPQDGFARLLSRIEALPPQAIHRAPAPVIPLWRRYAAPAGVAAAAAIVAGFTFWDAAPARTPRDVSVSGFHETSARAQPLRAGEVYVHADPDDPAVRRSQRLSGSPGMPGSLRLQPIPVRFGDDRPVR